MTTNHLPRIVSIAMISIGLAANLALVAAAQKPASNEGVRGAFLKTRPKASPSPAKPPSPARPQPTVKAAGKSQTQAKPPRLGLGYTLYQESADGQPVRVDAKHVFRTGDKVRLMVESNETGHLYVFHTENGKKPEMIFPDARLKDGDNRIEAHVPYEVPSRKEPELDNRWFVFKDDAAIEGLYIFVTRQPLPGVLTGKKLTEYCESNPNECPWRPTEMEWKLIADSANAQAGISQSRDFGQVETPDEADAVSRGFGLKNNARAPSVTKMNESPKAGTVMLKVELKHK